MAAADQVMWPIREAELLSRVRHTIRINLETALRNAGERECLAVTRQVARANESLRRPSLQDGLTGARTGWGMRRSSASRSPRHPRITISVDVAGEVPGQESATNTLRDIADTAMSRCRAAGRNWVTAAA
jgi:PleD family two-component response regulator